MNDNVLRVPARSLKGAILQRLRGVERAVGSNLRFSTEGDWWGFPFFSLSASRYFGDKETRCLLAAWNRRHHRSKGTGFLTRGFLPTGQHV